MSFPDAIRTCFRKYATFSGRAARPEYWWFVLFIVLGNIVLDVVDGALFGSVSVVVAPGTVQLQSRSVLGAIFALATLIPALAAGWRRMHDTGRSGLFLIYPLIAMVGVFTYFSFVAGLGGALSGSFGPYFAEGAGLIGFLGLIIAIFSPLIVIWWLTRPTQPKTNEWGPPPGRPA
ncbi:DUF805 domain-containing protein [Psychromarinibacter sp. C21-152]|uniref:DUF805 domain-containing protein n=1 Tax=Psychromarinibacter sediminicola TaxID=3033385 RepID=A0AAE3NWM1_9RHOB|nr:DUF805 domain-containing protein [Psychromarinibacter sediminicola]MDF0602295.1 DUF805 domain-containing protein [Psychromarinibacter sediminicola]